jgi:hypothetical protein
MQSSVYHPDVKALVPELVDVILQVVQAGGVCRLLIGAITGLVHRAVVVV